MKIPYNDLSRIHKPIETQLCEAFQTGLKRNDFIGGDQVVMFQEKLKEVFSLCHVQTCANGTDAIIGALKALNLKPDDEVIVPAMTWISTAEVVDQAGAKIVFCDVSQDTFVMESDNIEAVITKNTKAVILVHLYGNMPNMEKIQKLVDKYQINLIEDCAQAHLSKYDGSAAGTFGRFGTFSFFPGKNLGALGDAGAVTTTNRDDDVFLKMFFNHGQLNKNDHQIIGINSRLDALQARFLNIKVDRIREWTDERIQIACHYNNAFKNLNNVNLPQVHCAVEHSYHIYSVLAPNRPDFIQHLRNNNVGFNINYPIALHKTPAYKPHNQLNLKNAQRIASQQVSLPIFPKMTHQEIEKVIDVVSSYNIGK